MTFKNIINFRTDFVMRIENSSIVAWKFARQPKTGCEIMSLNCIYLYCGWNLCFSGCFKIDDWYEINTKINNKNKINKGINHSQTWPINFADEIPIECKNRNVFRYELYWSVTVFGRMSISDVTISFFFCFLTPSCHWSKCELWY